MAGKAGSAAELIEDQARLLAARLGELVLSLEADASPETLARAEKLSRVIKLAADAGKAVVAVEATARKACASPDVDAPHADPGPPDNDEMDMDDDHFAPVDFDRLERLRDRIERRITELLGGDERKSAPAGLRAGGSGASPLATLGAGVEARAAPA